MGESVPEEGKQFLHDEYSLWIDDSTAREAADVGKILVVDPSLIDRKRIRNILEAAGHAVMEAESPEEAIGLLTAVPRGAVKLVLTELQFEQGAGTDLIRWARAQENLMSVPILVIAPQPSRETVIALVSEGASTIITKPFGADMLLRRVTNALSEHAVLRQGEENSLSWQIEEYLRRELKRSERIGAPFSLVICRVTDLLEGRAIPALMAELAHIVRESDILARLGHDQVVLLLPEADAVGAWTVEDRIWQIVRDLAEPSETRPAFRLDVLTGIATFPSEAADAESLLILARDRASRHPA
jgi:PleD family two-component response regulator